MEDLCWRYSQDLKDIITSNINVLWDKVRDLVKMVEQYLCNARADLVKIKTEAAAVVAEEIFAKKVLDAHKYNITRYELLTVKVVTSNEDKRSYIFRRAD